MSVKRIACGMVAVAVLAIASLRHQSQADLVVETISATFDWSGQLVAHPDPGDNIWGPGRPWNPNGELLQIWSMDFDLTAWQSGGGNWNLATPSVYSSNGEVLAIVDTQSLQGYDPSKPIHVYCAIMAGMCWSYAGQNSYQYSGWHIMQIPAGQTSKTETLEVEVY